VKPVSKNKHISMALKVRLRVSAQQLWSLSVIRQKKLHITRLNRGYWASVGKKSINRPLTGLRSCSVVDLAAN